MKNKITVETLVSAPITKVWECWNEPEHIPGWAFASDDWGANAITNDLKTGGAFKTNMFAKDGSVSFDLEGVYGRVDTHKLIEYTMSDDRQVSIEFSETPEGILIVESFDPENENPEELQKEGWQGVLDNFKKYVEGI